MKKYLIIIICLLVVFLASCKQCNKDDSIFLTESEIKANYNKFDITMDMNGVKFRLIKTSKGYYYENVNTNDSIYYNRDLNESYKIDKTTNSKILVLGNYNFSEQLNNVYYLLTYHLTDERIEKMNSEQTTYLNRDVTEYSRVVGDVEEKYYIDNELGGCLYFLIDDGVTRVICKVDSLKFGNDLLNEFEEYTTLSKANTSVLKSKQEVLDSLVEYDISFNNGDNSYHIIKSNEGFFYSIKDDKGLVSYLYVNSEQQWYLLDLESKEKYYSNSDEKVEDIEENLLKLLPLVHINEIDSTFYEKTGTKYLDYDVTVFGFENIDNNINITYYVNIESGLCLKYILEVGKEQVVFDTINLSFEGDVSTYIEYDLSKNQIYPTWPESHEYLEGISPLSYGTFYIGYENESGLTIIYNNYSSSFVDSTVDEFKEFGFVDGIEDFEYDSDFAYLVYNYTSTNAKGITLVLTYDNISKQLTLTFSK